MKLTKRETALSIVFLSLVAGILLFLYIRNAFHYIMNPPSILEKANWHGEFVKRFFVDGNQFDYFGSDTGSTVSIAISVPNDSYGDELNMEFYGSSGKFRTKRILLKTSGEVAIGNKSGYGSSSSSGSNWVCMQSDTMNNIWGHWPQPAIPKVPLNANSWNTLDYGSMLPLNPSDVYVKHIAQFQYPSNRVVSVVEFRIVPGHLSSDSTVASREWWSPELGLMAFNDLQGRIYIRILDGEKVESTTMRKE